MTADPGFPNSQPVAGAEPASRAPLVVAYPGADWHAQTIDAAARLLDVDLSQGLTEPEVHARRQRVGPNRLTEPRRVSFGHIFAEEVREPMILLLAVVAVLYSLWGKLEDTVTITLVIAAVVFIEVYTEFRAKAAVAALGRLTAPTCPVVRAGRITDIPSEDLVPGDVVVLRSGERVPADVRLIESAGLQLDEAALTGESLPVRKDPDPVLDAAAPLAERHNMAYAATTVAAGAGRGMVVATGMDTELGRITGLVREAKPPRTPLQQSMRQLAGRLARVAIALSLLIPLLGVAGGQPVRQMILIGLTLAFATIPEELPILVTMVLGLGAWRLSRRHALIRRLRAAETLGEVSVIVTDKTGTLTQNRMTVTQLWTGRWSPISAELSAGQRELLAAAARCHDAAVIGSGDRLQVLGDPIDAAILTTADRHGLLNDRNGADRVGWYAFDSAHPVMTAIIKTEAGIQGVTKGAPEAVLPLCRQTTAHGSAIDLDDATRRSITTAVAAAAAEGARVVAVATRHLEGGIPPERDQIERDLTLIGLIAISDPPRPEAADAVHAVQAAGIRVVMVTGDHPTTATAIAETVGLDHEGVRTGTYITTLDNQSLDNAVSQFSVFARATPADKLRIVEALHRQGQIVAVTGDGINDAPALSQADIGVAMGDGTDVAKEAADMILADDNFATIATAVGEGRHLFDNLRKGIRYYLACKIALIATSAAGVIAGYAVPFAPIQIVFMEAFMDIAASTTFVTEGPEGDLMTRPPRPPGTPFMDRGFLTAMTAGGTALFTAVAGTYLWASISGLPAHRAQTIAFVAWMVGYIALAWTMRSQQPTRQAGLLTNKTLLAWTAATAAAITVVTAVPTLRQALKLGLLSPGQWAIALTAPLLAIAALETSKTLRQPPDGEKPG